MSSKVRLLLAGVVAGVAGVAGPGAGVVAGPGACVVAGGAFLRPGAALVPAAARACAAYAVVGRVRACSGSSGDHTTRLHALSDHELVRAVSAAATGAGGNRSQTSSKGTDDAARLLTAAAAVVAWRAPTVELGVLAQLGRLLAGSAGVWGGRATADLERLLVTVCEVATPKLAQASVADVVQVAWDVGCLVDHARRLKRTSTTVGADGGGGASAGSAAPTAQPHDQRRLRGPVVPDTALASALLFEAVAVRLHGRLDSVQPSHLSVLAWGCAKAGVWPPAHPHGSALGPFLEGLGDHCAARCALLQPHQAGCVAWAFGVLGIAHERLLGAIVADATGRLGSFQPRQVVNLLWACVVLGLTHHGRRLCVKTQQALHRDPHARARFLAPPTNAVGLLWGAVALKCEDPALFARLFAALRALPVLTGLGETDLAKLAYVHARCSPQKKGAMSRVRKSLAEEAVRRAPNLSLPTLVALVWACTRPAPWAPKHPKGAVAALLARAKAVFVEHQARGLIPEELSQLANAYADVPDAHGVLVAVVAQAVATWHLFELSQAVPLLAACTRHHLAAFHTANAVLWQELQGCFALSLPSVGRWADAVQIAWACTALVPKELHLQRAASGTCGAVSIVPELAVAFARAPHEANIPQAAPEDVLRCAAVLARCLEAAQTHRTPPMLRCAHVALEAACERLREAGVLDRAEAWLLCAVALEASGAPALRELVLLELLQRAHTLSAMELNVLRVLRGGGAAG